jgi:hypothetical protein
MAHGCASPEWRLDNHALVLRFRCRTGGAQRDRPCRFRYCLSCAVGISQDLFQGSLERRKITLECKSMTYRRSVPGAGQRRQNAIDGSTAPCSPARRHRIFPRASAHSFHNRLPRGHSVQPVRLGFPSRMELALHTTFHGIGIGGIPGRALLWETGQVDQYLTTNQDLLA